MVTVSRTGSGPAWAGLALGPGAWAVNTQGNLSLTPLSCASHIPWTVGLSLAMAAVALAGAALSWRAWRAAGGLERHLRTGDGRPHLALAGIGVGMGLLFALVILTQGSAGLLFSGCER